MSKIEELKKIVEEGEKFEKEISEVETLVKNAEDAKIVYLELKGLAISELANLKEKLSNETYVEFFGSTKVTSGKSKVCSRESINFKTVERLLSGETLFAIAAGIYKDKTHPISDKPESGTDRVIDGKADLETVYLTGRHVEDFFKKCPEYGRITKGLSKVKGKIYAPVIELSEVGKEAFN